MRPCTRYACSLLLAALAAPADAGAPPAPREPLWQTTLVGRNQAFMGAAVVKGRLAFIGGSELADELNGFERGLIAALDTATGEEVWAEEAETATGNDAGARGESFLGPLAVGKRVVVAGGFRELDGPTDEGVVRAYDQQTGTLLWSRRIEQGTQTSVAVTGSIAIAATTLGTVGDPATTVLVRAHDLTTGAELWDDVYGASPENPLFRALAVAGRNVAVIGSQVGESRRELFVRVYDAKTGAPVFDDLDQTEGGAEDAFSATVLGKRLFVGGTRLEEMGGNGDEVVIAYDLKRKERAWTLPVAEEGDATILAMAAAGRTVFSASLNGFDVGVRAYDARTGIPRWDEVLDVNLTFVFRQIGALGRRLVIGCGGGVFAFDAKTGAPVWDAELDGLGAAIDGKLVVVPNFGGAAAYLAR